MPIYLDGSLGLWSRQAALQVPADDGPLLTELVTTGNSGSHASTSDFTLHNATDSIDIRWFGLADDYTPGSTDILVSQRNTNTPAFDVRVTTVGALQMAVNESGGATAVTETARTPGVLPTNGALAGFRWAITGDTTLRYYLADTPSDPEGTAWTQVGADVTMGAAFNMLGVGVPVRIGAGLGGTTSPFAGKTRQVRIFKDAVLVASPDFTIQAAAAASFIDAQGNTWTVNGDASIAEQA